MFLDLHLGLFILFYVVHQALGVNVGDGAWWVTVEVQPVIERALSQHGGGDALAEQEEDESHHSNYYQDDGYGDASVTVGGILDILGWGNQTRTASLTHSSDVLTASLVLLHSLSFVQVSVFL